MDKNGDGGPSPRRRSTLGAAGVSLPTPPASPDAGRPAQRPSAAPPSVRSDAERIAPTRRFPPRPLPPVTSLRVWAMPACRRARSVEAPSDEPILTWPGSRHRDGGRAVSLGIACGGSSREGAVKTATAPGGSRILSLAGGRPFDVRLAQQAGARGLARRWDRARSSRTFAASTRRSARARTATRRSSCREIDTNLDGIKDVVRTFNQKGESAPRRSGPRLRRQDRRLAQLRRRPSGRRGPRHEP